jgi:indolepyruvate ferredoxin oxidoreductase
VRREKRRRRKRGKFPDPAKRVVINELVCEGCGDCGVKSNCVSVAPVESEFGRKRTIDQSSCNKDYSCVNGFCPSFVTVEGGQLRKPQKAAAVDFSGLPAPALPTTHAPYGVLVTGIGGTGVGDDRRAARHGRAPRRQGLQRARHDRARAEERRRRCRTCASPTRPTSSTRRASRPARRSSCSPCDILTGVGPKALAKMQKGVTKALVNTALVMPAQFTREPDLRFPTGSMEQEIKDAVAPGDAEFLDGDQARHGPDGRLDRDQPVHGRLRLPARPHSGRRGGDPERRSS